MSSLGQRIAARPGDRPVLDTGGTMLRPGALAAGPAPAAGLRPALSIRDTGALLRVLAAHDGQAEAMLLLSADLPAADVAALMAEAGATALVSDRTDLDGALAPEAAVIAAPAPPPPSAGPTGS